MSRIIPSCPPPPYVEAVDPRLRLMYVHERRELFERGGPRGMTFVQFCNVNVLETNFP